MKIGKSTEYALLSAVHIAGNYKEGSVLTILNKNLIKTCHSACPDMYSYVVFPAFTPIFSNIQFLTIFHIFPHASPLII